MKAALDAQKQHRALFHELVHLSSCNRLTTALEMGFVYHGELLKKQKPDQRKPQFARIWYRAVVYQHFAPLGSINEHK